ncbi:MAG: WGR domain-containing protein [Arcicella sp.]|nr:WGR domain-containing protein [Arcicella sp.]
MNKYLLFQDETANKFYRIIVEETSLIIIFGKVGTIGRSTLTEFESVEEALKEAQKLLSAKTKNGYKENGEFEFLEEDFWNIIEKTNKQCDGDKDEQADLITEILSTRPTADLLK